jgi:hypothetical protein
MTPPLTRQLPWSIVRILFATGALVAVACGGADDPSIGGDDGEPGESSQTPSSSTPALAGDASAAGSDGGVAMAGHQPGTTCTGAETVACFTGPANLRGLAGCKDGTQKCESNGEFSKWGACVGEVTTCAAPADAGTPAVDGAAVDGAAAAPPELVPGGNGVQIAPPKYADCVKLPNAGKRGYGKCAADQVVVIINDGKAQEMTCCPIGANVLSSVGTERDVLRTGFCGADEVATGMENPSTPGVFCSKINATYLKLSSRIPSVYTTRSMPGDLGIIANSYNNNDTCICPEGSIMVGGHTPADNRCTDQCVRIEKK